MTKLIIIALLLGMILVSGCSIFSKPILCNNNSDCPNNYWCYDDNNLSLINSPPYCIKNWWTITNVSYNSDYITIVEKEKQE